MLCSMENLAEAIRSIRRRFRKYSNPNNSLMVNRRQYRDYFKFTVVRDPWNRVYSAYRNLTTDEFHRRNLNITGDPSLNSFLKEFIGKDMLKPQTYWIKDYDGRIPMDLVVKFEELESGFREVVRALGDQSLSLPHENMGGSGNYRDKYDDESAEIVSRFYSEEIGLFGYSF